MNHNQICACINFSNIKKDNFVNTYCKEFNTQLSKNNLVFDYAGIQVRSPAACFRSQQLQTCCC